MPRYDFKCSECKSVKEVVQSYYTEPPVCCGKPMERQIGNIRQWRFKHLYYHPAPKANSPALAAAATKGYEIAQAAGG